MQTEEVLFTRTKQRMPINVKLVGDSGVKQMKGNQTEYEGIDFFAVLKQFTTDPAGVFLLDIIDGKDNSTNITKLGYADLTKSDKNRISKGYTKLNELNLVTRIERGSYLVNPRISPPYPEFFEKVCQHWFQLTGKQP